MICHYTGHRKIIIKLSFLCLHLYSPDCMCLVQIRECVNMIEIYCLPFKRGEGDGRGLIRGRLIKDGLLESRYIGGKGALLERVVIREGGLLERLIKNIPVQKCPNRRYCHHQ